MKFTDENIAALRPKAKIYEVWDDGRKSFSLRVSPNGRKMWRFMYRRNRKVCILTFGRFPEISLYSARAMRERAKEALARGEDPQIVRKAQKLLKNDRLCCSGKMLDAAVRGRVDLGDFGCQKQPRYEIGGEFFCQVHAKIMALGILGKEMRVRELPFWLRARDT